MDVRRRDCAGLSNMGVGIDAIDIEAAQASRKIPVVVIFLDYAEETVAEGAFALMIALARKLGALHVAKCRRRGWAWPVPQWLGNDLAGKTLGLIGVGRIGRSLARMAGAGVSECASWGLIHLLTARQCGDLAWRNAIDWRICCRWLISSPSMRALNKETRHRVGSREIALMKPSAMLINVSRGALVDEAALVEALQARLIAGAGLDVFRPGTVGAVGPSVELFV